MSTSAGQIGGFGFYSFYLLVTYNVISYDLYLMGGGGGWIVNMC
jgi:hypothetical protein